MSRAFATGRWLMRIRPAPLASWLKRMMRVHRVPHATTEGTFWLDPASQFGQALFHQGIYEPETLAVLKNLLRAEDIFVDIGANEGYFSVVASRLVGPAGRVIAVEPQRRLRPVLEQNFALNGCATATIVSAAISDEPGDRPLQLGPDMNSGATGFLRHARYPVATQSTPCLTLTRLCADERISGEFVMKMDIESWEVEALLGSPDLLHSGRIREIVLELHPELIARRGRSVVELTDFLARCGYGRKTWLVWLHQGAA